MKSLSLEKMEVLKGNGCSSRVIDLGLSTAGFMATYAPIAISLGPVGWLAGAGLAIALIAVGKTGADLVSSGECF
ncbi:hypothetical protein ACV07N_08695 [Roseivirga echinicomitans]